MSDVWTDEVITEMTDMWTSGVSATEIAKALGPGFTKNMIIGKTKRLGLQTPKQSIWTDALVKKLKELHERKMTISEMVKELGGKIGYRAIYCKLKYLDLTIWKINPDGEPYEIRRNRNRFIPVRAYARKPNKPLPSSKPEQTGCEARNLTILELQSGHCRWIGERNGLDTTYCAADVQADSSYCPAHHALVYVKPQDRRPGKRQSDVRREGGGKSAALAFSNE